MAYKVMEDGGARAMWWGTKDDFSAERYSDGKNFLAPENDKGWLVAEKSVRDDERTRFLCVYYRGGNAYSLWISAESLFEILLRDDCWEKSEGPADILPPVLDLADEGLRDFYCAHGLKLPERLSIVPVYDKFKADFWELAGLIERYAWKEFGYRLSDDAAEDGEEIS